MEVVRNYGELYQVGLISGREMVLVVEGYLLQRLNRQSPYVRRLAYGSFDLNEMNGRDVYLSFRFHRADIQRLVNLFGISNLVCIPESGYKIPSLTAFCIMLRRLAYPNRLSDLEPMFGYSGATLGIVANYVMRHIDSHKGHLLQDLNNLKWLTHERLEYYSAAVAEKGSPLTNCWAFIDGTARHMCRPTVNQKAYFSGHKRYHCLKYQSIVTPDGIIVSLLGGYEGKRHDAGIWASSGIKCQLDRLCVAFSKTYVIYGDPAYPVSNRLIAPFSSISTEERAPDFNRAMSAVRQSVEWGFGKVVRDFAFLDFHKNQKLMLQDLEGIS